MQARIAPMGKLAKTDETLLAKYHGLRKVSRDRNELCNHGGVAEWSNAPVLKTGIPQGIVGSKRTPCACSPAYFMIRDPEEAFWQLSTAEWRESNPTGR